MTEVLRQWLRVFHAQCLRAMCRVTRKHTWEFILNSDRHTLTNKKCVSVTV